MVDITLSDKSADAIAADATVVLTAPTKDGARVIDPVGVSPAAVKALNEALATLEAKGRADEVLRLSGAGDLSGLVIAVGSGVDAEQAPTKASALRDAAGAAARSLTGTSSAVFAFPAVADDLVQAICEGIALGAYAYTAYKSKPKDALAKATLLVTDAKSSGALAGVETTAAVVTAQNWARDLVNMPPLDLNPASFADIVRKRMSGTKVKVDIMDEKALAKAECGGLIGVGRGSARPPRLVTLTYKPAKATKHISIVGKGITFDSGGLCIKPANGMATMKCDMAGAAAVAAFLEAVAALELPVAVTGYLCLAENMTGADAQRPGDVIRMHDGTTVEIDNTDAEGRLVMADGLCYATEEEPDLIIDIATLTGAAVLALGNRTAAIVGNNDEVRDELIAASERVDEHMWPMPLLEHLRPSIDSEVADLKHTGERMGGLITAAMFLKEFVGEKNGEQIDWIHMDIAAPAFNEGSPYGVNPKGGTGFAVRTLVELARA
ncbi:leucyl aminopeptidase [Dermacoccus nishinomiyaensis]|uniref:leucyl aminopeptidase n=1 Tax=Dermacoccus nishinomiyaensis TaxID=1274 RepID=UPI00093D634E|nr:leucyl aminopeptidase [Dermacoccus nishinomiyaensis]